MTSLDTVTVQTQINGQLQEIGFTEGQMVKKGDFLAQIDPRPYVAALEHSAVAAATGAILMLVGFGYFYARLQTDPVPRRYSQLVSLVISIIESISDGLLGIVLWLGPLIAVDYYAHLGRHWGPSLRVDQSIGAGILWIVGDVLGVPFIIVLMRLFSADEKVHADAVDNELESAPELSGGTSGLWWENDPQLRERMGRR